MDNVPIKCVVLGDEGVGKKGLQVRMFYRVPQSSSFYVPLPAARRLGCLSLMKIRVGDENVVFRTVATGYRSAVKDKCKEYPCADFILMCFSLVDPESYDHIYTIWYPEVKKYAPMVPIFLVGTKYDLVCDGYEREETLRSLRERNLCPLTHVDGRRLCDEIGAVNYFECSSLTGQGLEDLITAAVRHALSRKTFEKKTNK